MESVTFKGAITNDQWIGRDRQMGFDMMNEAMKGCAKRAGKSPIPSNTFDSFDMTYQKKTWEEAGR